MTKYFMRNTPYYSAEVMTMTVPGFKPRGREFVMCSLIVHLHLNQHR